jgi:hypothetical protein
MTMSATPTSLVLPTDMTTSLEGEDETRTETWETRVGSYLSTGAALALSRLVLLMWSFHRYVSRTVTERDLYLLWALYPESLLGHR